MRITSTFLFTTWSMKPGSWCEKPLADGHELGGQEGASPLPCTTVSGASGLRRPVRRLVGGKDLTGHRYFAVLPPAAANVLGHVQAVHVAVTVVVQIPDVVELPGLGAVRRPKKVVIPPIYVPVPVRVTVESEELVLAIPASHAIAGSLALAST